MARGLTNVLRRVVPAAVAVGGLTVAIAGGPAAAATHRPARPASSMCGTITTAPAIKHVVVILEENTSYSGIIGNSSAPYINSVASACGVASAYHNITHESLANYLGMTDGMSVTQLNPYIFDCSPSSSCEVKTNNIFNEVATKGGWRAYDESMASSCDKTDAGDYAARHNPAVYYTDLASKCRTDDRSLGTTSSSPLLKAFASETTAPAFTFVTPNLCDDMHGDLSCLFSNLTQLGDTWLSQWLPLITGTNVYKSGDTAVFVVWDEGSGGFSGETCAPASETDESCHVPLLVVAPSVKAGTVVSTALNHYSLLKTTEDLLGVPELNQAKTATSLAAAFNL